MNNMSDTDPNNKKRRGRPKTQTNPKQNILTQVADFNNEQNNGNNNEDEEDIILHLPINIDDVNPPNVQNNIFTLNDVTEDSDDEKLTYSITQKKEIHDKNNIITMFNKVYKLNTNFVYTDSITGKQVIQNNNGKSCCWWCTYDFTWIPCLLPEKIINDVIFVFGCFCSINCSASYNLQMNDYNVWNRYSLLKKVYNVTNIKLAPQKEVFKKFGGPLDHDNYLFNKCEYEYMLLMPPLTSIVPLVEEFSVTSEKNVIVDKKPTLVLKRNKPLPLVKIKY